MSKKSEKETLLKKTWEHLDQACGNIEHAIELIAENDDLPREIQIKSEELDTSALSSLKEDIEQELLKRTDNAQGIEEMIEDGECDE